MPGGAYAGRRRRDDQMIERAAGVVDDPLPFVRVDHVPVPVGEHAGCARVDHEQARPPEVAVVRPPARGRLAIAHARERPQAFTRVLVALHLREHRFLGQLGRRQVAEVLVQPVRHEGARHPLVPPGQRAHLRRPRTRRCSSRRSARGRRRSSPTGRSRAASGCRDPTTTRGTAACTPRSRRLLHPAARRCLRRASMNAAVSGGTSSAYTWSPSSSNPSGQAASPACSRRE